MRRLYWSLIIVAVLYGVPRAAMILNIGMGPWSGQVVQADGSVTDMRFDRNLPRPDWLPLPPDADIVQASQQTSSKDPGVFGIVEFLTRMPLNDARRFFTNRLVASGFAVTDEGIGTLNQPTADLLAVARMLTARRAPNGEEVSVQLRGEEGWVGRARLVQITWRTRRAP